MRLTLLLVVVGGLVGVNTFIMIGWGAMRPLQQLGDEEVDGPHWVKDASPSAAAQDRGDVGGEVRGARPPAEMLLGRPLFVQGHANGAVAELLCADQPHAGCHSWWQNSWWVHQCGGSVGAPTQLGQAHIECQWGRSRQPVARPPAGRTLGPLHGAMQLRARSCHARACVICPVHTPALACA
jgi:hypothetical protein